MPANTIRQADIQQFDADVHIQYQQTGSKLRDFVRKKTGVSGASVKFQKIGKGEATQKPQNGNVVAMNPDHSNVSATLEDWYAPQYVDHFDLAKTNIDEKNAMLKIGAGAIGRKADTLLIAAANTTTNIIDESANTYSLKVLLKAVKALLGEDVFEGPENQVTVVLGTDQWVEMYEIDEFKNSFYQKMGATGVEKIGNIKQFMGMNFIHSNLLESTSGVTDCLIFDKNAIGLAECEFSTSSVDWIPEKVAHLVNTKMSLGACLIDEKGCAKLKVKN